MGIACPYCGTENKTRVTDKRNTSDYIRRRRMCKICGKKFSTYEMRFDEIWKIQHSKLQPRRLKNEHSNG